MQRFNVIITGSTGMVGKSVLLECIEHPSIEKILLINRSSLNFNHPKVNEILLSNFSQTFVAPAITQSPITQSLIPFKDVEPVTLTT